MLNFCVFVFIMYALLYAVKEIFFKKKRKACLSNTRYCRITNTQRKSQVVKNKKPQYSYSRKKKTINSVSKTGYTTKSRSENSERLLIVSDNNLLLA